MSGNVDTTDSVTDRGLKEQLVRGTLERDVVLAAIDKLEMELITYLAFKEVIGEQVPRAMLKSMFDKTREGLL